MSSVTVESVSESPGSGGAMTIGLDPFSYLAGVASKVIGLGGAAPGHDPSYVFHTDYVRAASRQASFTVRFAGLTGRRGTLYLSIHMLPVEAGAQVRLVASERILLTRLVQRGGEVALRFEGFHDVTYAILGAIPDNTDATAHGLTVTLDLAEPEAEYDGPPIEARNTAFGAKALQPQVQLISLDRAKLSYPVSQPCTASQFDEPAYAEWMGRLRLPNVRSRRQWAYAFVLQALSSYGMLEAGARGLGFGVSDEPLPAFLAAQALDVVATARPVGAELPMPADPADREAEALDRLRRPAICDDAKFDRHVGFRRASMRPIPRDLVNFDFAWSCGAAAELGSVGDGLRFLRESLACLRPGGFAVHVTQLNLSTDQDVVETPALALFRRRDLEGLALDLISRGHEIAQIKIDKSRHPRDLHVDMPELAGMPRLDPAAGGYASTAFGLVLRRAPSAF